jgi:hypothetical protein
VNGQGVGAGCLAIGAAAAIAGGFVTSDPAKYPLIILVFVLGVILGRAHDISAWLDGKDKHYANRTERDDHDSHGHPQS